MTLSLSMARSLGFKASELQEKPWKLAGIT
jgi:hypothetical protein